MKGNTKRILVRVLILMLLVLLVWIGFATYDFIRGGGGEILYIVLYPFVSDFKSEPMKYLWPYFVVAAIVLGVMLYRVTKKVLARRQARNDRDHQPLGY